MSTELEPVQTDFDKLEQTPVTKLDDTVAVLEQNLQREIDHRKEERFLWIFALVGFFDIIALDKINAVSGTIFFLLEIVFLIACAKWCGVDFVVVLLERIFNKWVRKSDEN